MKAPIKFKSLENYDLSFLQDIYFNRVKPINDDFLIFYICSSNYWYLRSMIISIVSMILNSDFSNYRVKIYLSQNLMKYKNEIDFLLWLGVEVVVKDSFFPKFEVVWEKDNDDFSKVLCCDCDLYCSPVYSDGFEKMFLIDSPIVCNFEKNVSVSYAVEVRKPQSKKYISLEMEKYLDFFYLINRDFFNKNVWPNGCFSMYNKKMIEERKECARFWSIIRDDLNTTCDETLIQMCSCIDNFVSDIDGIINFKIGSESYSIKNSFVHPILGNNCNLEKENHDFWNRICRFNLWKNKKKKIFKKLSNLNNYKPEKYNKDILSSL